MIVPIIVLLLQVTSCAQAGPFSSKPHAAGDDLEALILDQKVDLYTVHQLNSLVDKLEAVPSSDRAPSCDPKTQSALKDLKKLIDSDEHDVCSPEKVAKIETYYEKYLNSTSVDGHSPAVIPSSLRKFALAYIMKVSDLCKHNMVIVLQNRVGGLLDEEDFLQVKKYTDRSSPAGKVLGSVGHFDDVFLPTDLMDLDATNRKNEKWLRINHDAHHVIERLQDTCRRRFKPVYEPLMVPVARLANLGFNGFSTPKADSAARDEVTQWSRILFFCETLDRIEVKPSVAQQDDSVPVLDIDTQADEPTVEGLSNSELEDPNAPESSSKPAVVLDPHYNIKIGEKILDPEDSRLLKAIASIKTNRSAVKNAKKRLRANYFASLKNNLKRFRLHSVYASLHKALRRKIATSVGVTGDQREFVETLDSIIGDEVGSDYKKMPTSIKRQLVYAAFDASVTTIALSLVVLAIAAA